MSSVEIDTRQAVFRQEGDELVEVIDGEIEVQRAKLSEEQYMIRRML